MSILQATTSNFYSPGMNNASLYKTQLKPLNYTMNNISLRQARHPGSKVNKHRSFQQPYLPPPPSIPRHLLRADTVLRHKTNTDPSELVEPELQGLKLNKQSGYSREGISHGAGLKPLQTHKDRRYRPDTNRNTTSTDLSSLKETLLWYFPFISFVIMARHQNYLKCCWKFLYKPEILITNIINNQILIYY